MSAISVKAAGLAAVLLCAGVLAGCAAPASESAAGPTPEPESSAASTTLDANRREPIDPEYLILPGAGGRARGQLLADGTGRERHPLSPPAWVCPAWSTLPDDEEAADLLDNTDAGSGTDYRTKIDDGEAFLVKVSFYVVYSPEADYGGPQYPDGTNSIYVFTPVDDARPCEAISGWYSTDSTAAIPELSDEARELNLNEWQHTMLVHQCRALAAAGITDFAAPADWTEEQTAYYLAARSRDYGPNLLGFTAEQANRLLTIDFTAEDDWSSNARFFDRLPGTCRHRRRPARNARLHRGRRQQQRHHHRHRQRGRHPRRAVHLFHL